MLGRYMMNSAGRVRRLGICRLREGDVATRRERPGYMVRRHTLLWPSGRSSVKTPDRRGILRLRPSRTEIVMGSAAEAATDIHPFHVEIPNEQLAELRRRIEAT